MSNYVYAKDDKLYAIIYGNERYPQIEPISGNYEDEKVVRIYNERILKTDKGYYEIVKYFDKELNKYVYLTLKIKLLSKYYDEVLTFTYKYVILKDYTLIPLTDIIVRNPAYQEDYFIISEEGKPETLEERVKKDIEFINNEIMCENNQGLLCKYNKSIKGIWRKGLSDGFK